MQAGVPRIQTVVFIQPQGERQSEIRQGQIKTTMHQATVPL